MPCYHPITAYYSQRLNQNGKRSVVFRRVDGFADMPVTLPCGGCIGCRLDRARQWAVRCMHEAKCHNDNSFITLTYNDENLPYNGSIVKRDLQLFFKRLRKSLEPVKIRYFACGEYGDSSFRPHYHALVFGYRPHDQKLHTESDGKQLYTSQSLAKVWTAGNHLIGDVTYDSARYVASYINKRVTGDAANDHYVTVDPYTGELYNITPEFVLMSRGRGIGRDWFDRYYIDYYNNDYLIVNGSKQTIPKYYDKLLETIDPAHYKYIKAGRNKALAEKEAEYTPDRLEVKEYIQINKQKLYNNQSL
jgi:hypothetical protein